MSRLFACTLLIFGLVNFPLARAQTTAPVVAPDRPFMVEDAIALAIRKNFDLQLQSFSTEQARETLNGTRGPFDPTITASVRRNVSQAASNTSRLDGAQTEGPRNDNTTASVGVQQRLPATNGTIGVSTNVTRGATNSTNALLNPSFGNGISANVSQPLLQNFGRTVATAAIERAKLGLDIAYITYKRQVLTLIASTENSYYNLVTARETFRIRQLSLDLAQALFNENTARRTTGVMTDLDVLTAEAGVANARRALIQAQQQVADAEDALLALLNVQTFDSRPGPVKFDDYVEGPPNFALSYKTARDFYPDTLSAADTLKQLQITLDVARKNLLPSLNLDGSLGYTARSVNSGYADVVSNLPNDHGNNWSIGLTYSMPIGRHSDKANYRSAVISVESQKVRIDQLEQQLLVSVRTAVRSVQTNLAAVEVAAKSTELSTKQYEQQKARFDAGLSTSRAVLQAQDDLETARFNELGAKLTLRRAATELHRLEGTSLQRYRIQLPE